MKTVRVALPGREYDILIGGGLLEQAGERIKPLANGNGIAVVSDENVWRLHGETFEKSMRSAGLSFEKIIMQPGEGSKTLEGLAKVYDCFADAGLNRNGLVVAFGGGVIGDLAGFAAATWMRGVSYMQIPTTLLAQVDSSVGGKTAVDLPSGKNLAGAFHQPKLVIADTTVLETLPPREFACGMAEVIKYGAIFSEELFESLEQPLDKAHIPEIVEQCCILKRETVENDELDTGQRMLLNFGHTFGHAIESLGGFSRFNHGEGISIGMILAAKAGEQAGITPQGCNERLAKVLKLHSLPTESPYPVSQLVPGMLLDKKSRSGGVDLILLRQIGEAIIEHQTIRQLEQLT